MSDLPLRTGRFSLRCCSGPVRPFQAPSCNRLQLRSGEHPSQLDLRLLEESACEYDRRRSTVADLVVGRLRDLHEHLRSWMLYVYLLEHNAPSLVMVTSPSESTSILSMPRGPRELLTISEISFAAWMLFRSASLPFDSAVPSLRMMYWGLPDISNSRRYTT